MNQTPLLLGAVLRDARRRQGISQKDLALRLHVTRNTVINWEADKYRPDLELIPQLCELLALSPNALFRRETTGSGEAETRLLHNFRRLTPMSQRVVDSMVSTLLREEQEARDAALRQSARLFARIPGAVAAGPGSPFMEEKPAPVFLRENSQNRRADAIVRVSGDSMEPVYHSGDWVYFRYANRARSGEDVVCATADGAVLKRVDDDYTLYSVNPDRPFGRKTEDDHVTILGIVTGVVSSADTFTGADEDLLRDLFAEDLQCFAARYGGEEQA